MGEDGYEKCESTNMNVFSRALSKICSWLIHFSYTTATTILPPSMTSESDDIVKAIIDDKAAEKDDYIRNGISVKVMRSLKIVIGCMDFIILCCVSVLLAVGAAFIIKYKLLD